MGKKDKRIDAYIARSAPFARPILKHIRAIVHAGAPDVEETIKWGFPHFDLQGILCAMAAFKEHCAFGFWKASLMADPQKILGLRDKTAMGHLGRITGLGDLPPDRIFTSYVREAARLNMDGVKRPARPKSAKKPLVVPASFRAALKTNKRALATFEQFTESHKREYVEWVTEAKTEETRSRRLATALEWMAQGKPRNWKYTRK